MINSRRMRFCGGFFEDESEGRMRLCHAGYGVPGDTIALVEGKTSDI